jgi:hypothetical protein
VLADLAVADETQSVVGRESTVEQEPGRNRPCVLRVAFNPAAAERGDDFESPVGESFVVDVLPEGDGFGVGFGRGADEKRANSSARGTDVRASRRRRSEEVACLVDGHVVAEVSFVGELLGVASHACSRV